jgi:hypothetical protein
LYKALGSNPDSKIMRQSLLHQEFGLQDSNGLIIKGLICQAKEEPSHLGSGIPLPVFEKRHMIETVHG